MYNGPNCLLSAKCLPNNGHGVALLRSFCPTRTYDAGIRSPATRRLGAVQMRMGFELGRCAGRSPKDCLYSEGFTEDTWAAYSLRGQNGDSFTVRLTHRVDHAGRGPGTNVNNLRPDNTRCIITLIRWWSTRAVALCCEDDCPYGSMSCLVWSGGCCYLIFQSTGGALLAFGG